MTQRPEFMIVSMDNAIDYATNRNGGFIEILHTGPQLAEIAFPLVRARTLGMPDPNWIPTTNYYTASYTAIDDDHQTLAEMIEQLTTMMCNNIKIALERVGENRPILDVAMKELIIFVRLG